MRRRPEAVKNKTVSTQNRLTSITLDVENQTTKLTRKYWFTHIHYEMKITKQYVHVY